MQISVTQAASRALAATAPGGQTDPTAFQARLAAASASLAQHGPGSDANGSTSREAVDHGAGGVGATVAKGKTAADELADFLNMSVAERVRAAVLKDLGLSEEDLAALPPEQRAAVDKEIAERVAQALSGLTAPVTRERTVALADPSDGTFDLTRMG